MKEDKQAKASIEGLANDESKGLISRKFGIILFTCAAIILASLAFLAFKGSPSPKSVTAPAPVTSASKNPLPTSTLPGQTAADLESIEGPAVALAIDLSSRNWQATQAQKLLLVHNLITPNLYANIDAYVSSWNWATCISSKCHRNANLYSVSSKLIQGNRYLVNVTVSVTGNQGSSYPNLDYSFIVAPDANGTWYVIGTNPLPIPE